MSTVAGAALVKTASFLSSLPPFFAGASARTTGRSGDVRPSPALTITAPSQRSPDRGDRESPTLVIIPCRLALVLPAT
jgi:hypothetical protein